MHIKYLFYWYDVEYHHQTSLAVIKHSHATVAERMFQWNCVKGETVADNNCDIAGVLLTCNWFMWLAVPEAIIGDK